jgi:hypothetical protein
MKKKRLKVGVYIHNPSATTLRFFRCMQAWDMDFVSVWRDNLEKIDQFGIDTLLLHGGWYGINRKPGQDQYQVEANDEDRKRGEAVCRFVENGGGIVGVCAGSFNIVWLGLIEADISRAAGAGLHSLEVVDPEHPIAAPVIEKGPHANRPWCSIPIIRIGGPIFFPKKQNQMIFSYDWEKRLGAVLAAEFGKGRAVAVSPHPERTEHDLDEDVALSHPLMHAAEILHHSLLWSGKAK